MADIPLSTGLRGASEARAAYSELLDALCTTLGVPDPDRPRVRELEALQWAGATVGFRLEESRGLVQIYVEMPPPQALSDLDCCRVLLQKNVLLPAPYPFVFGMHPVSQRMLCCSYASLGRGSDAVQQFAARLRQTIAFAQSAWPA